MLGKYLFGRPDLTGIFHVFYELDNGNLEAMAGSTEHLAQCSGGLAFAIAGIKQYEPFFVMLVLNIVAVSENRAQGNS